MFKKVKDKVLCFDIEWIPDPVSGRVVYGLPEDTSDQKVMERMWKEGGATEEKPRPFIKTVLCRIVSICMVFRNFEPDADRKLLMHSIPTIPTAEKDCSEKKIIEEFLKILNKHRPQLVGFNSMGSDIPILIQRAIKHGLQGGFLTERPEKPWEGPDMFTRGNDWNIDLMSCLKMRGTSPSLHEISSVSGIPGKINGIDGTCVASMWLEGMLDNIVAYNEYDAITTYLLWLRMAHSAGLIKEYEEEQQIVRDMLTEETKKPDRKHLIRYLDRWEKMGK